MDKVLEQTLLYDFYGELLTEHQKNIYEDVKFRDFSLSEVAEANGISRQGVHDMVKRSEKALAEYEEKLGLVAKFQKTGQLVDQIIYLTEEFDRTRDPELVKEIRRISKQMGDL